MNNHDDMHDHSLEADLAAVQSARSPCSPRSVSPLIVAA